MPATVLVSVDKPDITVLVFEKRLFTQICQKKKHLLHQICLSDRLATAHTNRLVAAELISF
jgi:hypothetical protein